LSLIDGEVISVIKHSIVMIYDAVEVSCMQD